jgi:hypothetical protein
MKITRRGGELPVAIILAVGAAVNALVAYFVGTAIGDAQLRTFALFTWGVIGALIAVGNFVKPVAISGGVVVGLIATISVLVSQGASALTKVVFGVLPAVWGVGLIVLGARERPFTNPDYPADRALVKTAHPGIPNDRWAWVCASGEGLVLDFGRKGGRHVLKYGRLINPAVFGNDVPAADPKTGQVVIFQGPRQLEFIYRDLTLQQDFTMSIRPQQAANADRMLRAILRRQQLRNSAAWRSWKTLEISLKVPAGELERGASRQVVIHRMVACTRCAAIPGYNTACSFCGGKGYGLEQDTVTVRIRPGMKPNSTITLRGKGNEDLNGDRGPLVVRVACDAAYAS